MMALQLRTDSPWQQSIVGYTVHINLGYLVSGYLVQPLLERIHPLRLLLVRIPLLPVKSPS